MSRHEDTPGYLSEADQRLLGREFRIADPTAISGLLSRIPRDAPKPSILYKYEVPRTSRLLRCAVCGKALHRKGYVVRLATGELALVAERQCGRDAFGFQWEQVERSFNAELDRQIDLKRLVAMEPIVPMLLRELRHEGTRKAVAAYNRYRAQLLGDFGKLGQALARLAREGGELRVIRWVRNRTKEEERARSEKPDLIAAVEHARSPADRVAARKRLNAYLDRHPIEEPHEESIGRCAGYEMFRPEPDGPTALMSSAETMLSDAARSFADGNVSSDPAGVVRRVEQAVERLTQMIACLDRLAKFTMPHNIAAVARWLEENEDLAFELQAEGRALVNSTSGLRLSIDPDFNVPTLPSLGQLKSALRSL